MKNLDDLTNEEIQKKILNLFNEHPWVLRPDINNLTPTQEKIYYDYESLKISLQERHKRNYPQKYDFDNRIPYKEKLFV